VRGDRRDRRNESFLRERKTRKKECREERGGEVAGGDNCSKRKKFWRRGGTPEIAEWGGRKIK